MKPLKHKKPQSVNLYSLTNHNLSRTPYRLR